jgi:membrane associated rhomboid family serine protease
MFPLRDSTPRNSFPIINYTLIFINILVFFYQLVQPSLDGFVYKYAFIPAEFHPANIASYYYIFTSLFLHGGFLHLISNVWFLHIFGDNVEDVLGHFQYLIFYLLAGVAATLLQYYFTSGSDIPMIGASGAISGVAGAYFVLFRKSKVLTLVTYFFWIWDIVELPVWFFLGYWFVIQFFQGVGSIVSIDVQHGGVAYLAHIGGFIFGYLYAQKNKQQVVTSTSV